MAQCAKAKELILKTDDKVGMLADLTSVIASQGVNITALCGYSMEGVAIFMIVTSDNEKVKAIASEQGWSVQENDVIVVSIPNAVGAAQTVAEKIKAANLNLKYCYGTTCDCDPKCSCNMVLRADDNDAVIATLS
ncbi:hypothetical protein ACFL3D_02690 [Candidatus Omnitrophota bacterium]